MKKFKLTFLLLLVCIISGCGNSSSDDTAKTWFIYLVQPSYDETVIVYEEQKLSTDTGELNFQNRNTFLVHIDIFYRN